MTTQDDSSRLIIEGVMENNRIFRPSDWIDRLSSLWARFGADNKLRYSSKIYPCMINGERCLIVAKNLSQSDPIAYDFILKFARDNKLRVQEDRREQAEQIAEERRQERWNYAHFRNDTSQHR